MLRVGDCRRRVRELVSGIDGLYLSGRTQLGAELEERLEVARLSAMAVGEGVEFDLGGYTFVMSPRSLGRYRYRLEHDLAVIGVTVSSALPTLRVQFRAEALHCGLGPVGVVRWLDTVIDNEGLVVAGWMVSRADLFADVQGWALSGWDRDRFVCRARSTATYEDDTDLEGFVFGKRATGTLSCRIYDKTREVAGNGHDWWFDVWGDRYRSDDGPVMRVEFEFSRGSLKELAITSPADLFTNTGRLWAYSSGEWLTLRERAAHERPARWPLSASWARIQRVTLRGSAVPMERIRQGCVSGGLRQLMPLLNGCVASFAALAGHHSIEDACDALPVYLHDYERRSQQSFCDRVTEKRKARR